MRIVDEGPPRPRHEIVLARPSRHHVWIRGYWHHGHRGWVWVSGRWVEPPRHHAHWVAAHYRRTHGGWRYTPGHWSFETVIY